MSRFCIPVGENLRTFVSAGHTKVSFCCFRYLTQSEKSEEEHEAPRIRMDTRPSKQDTLSTVTCPSWRFL